MADTTNTRSGSRTYQLKGTLKVSATSVFSNIVIKTGLPYRKAMNVLEVNQMVWEGLVDNVVRTRAMMEVRVNGFMFRVWIEKE